MDTRRGSSGERAAERRNAANARRRDTAQSIDRSIRSARSRESREQDQKTVGYHSKAIYTPQTTSQFKAAGLTRDQSKNRNNVSTMSQLTGSPEKTARKSPGKHQNPMYNSYSQPKTFDFNR